MKRQLVVGALLVAALRPAGVFAEDYLPLVIGNGWHYQGIGGHSEDHVVTGTQTIWGSTTYVIDYQNSSSNEGLENYWTTDPSGDILLWGWWLEPSSFGILWSPPILDLDAPLFPGKTWVVITTGHELPDTTLLGTFEITFEVVESGTISVPAGDFPSFGISYVVNGPAPGSGEQDLTGAIVGSVLEGGPTSWYSDGIGEVQFDADDLYQLVSFNVPTATQPTTWGGIKGLYR